MKTTLIVLNAGEATRLRPITSNCSKAMVRVNGKPVIDYILDAVGSRVSDIVIVNAPGNSDVRRYLERRRLTQSVQYVTQPKPRGPTDALSHALAVVKDGASAVVWYGDTLLFDPLPIGTNFFATSTPVEDQSEWLVWDGEKFFLKPESVVEGGRAVVGVFGFSDVSNLRAATSIAYSYDIDRVLELVGASEYPTTMWHDIGVPSRYHRTCAALLNEKARAFNRFSYDPRDNVLYKSATGAAALTLEAEAAWYDGLNPTQRLFTPRVIKSVDSLGLSFESGTLLSDLALYEDLGLPFWLYVLRKLTSTVHDKFHNVYMPMRNFHADFPTYSKEMWVDGVMTRLSGTDLMDDETRVFLLEAGRRAAKASRPVQCMHGDLHLANVLYDAQIGKIVLIDPRGRYGRYVGCAGGDLYDWCKLAYDCYHGFSAIVAGAPPSPSLREAFLVVAREMRLDVELVLDGAAVLMAAGIPLHYDNPRRQRDFADTVTAYVRERTLSRRSRETAA